MLDQEELYFNQGQLYLKFIRRRDISPELRLYIGSVALYFSHYGTISALSRKYGISRTFIYTLRHQLMMQGMVMYGMADKLSNGSVKKGDEKLELITEILSDDRGGKSWEGHWQSLLDQGVIPLYVTNDEGKGMRCASDASLAGVARQSDSFHALAHRLGPLCWTLERQAYQAIDWEYDRQRVLQSAKSEAVKAKRQEAYEQAIGEANRRIELYDKFVLIYQMMIETLQVFDKNGEPCCPANAQKDLVTAMEWMEELGHQKANEQLVVIKGLLPSLFHFLEYGLGLVQTLEGSLKTGWENQAFKIVCKAWQCRKNALKAKKGVIKKYYRHKHLYWLELGAKVFEQSESNFETFQKRIYKSLDSIVQSSAMVETINSIIRLNLNDCKNQVTQSHLNLIRFYHNHRKYVQGKRKGFSPMELLTGQKQDEDWLDLLLQKLKIAA